MNDHFSSPKSGENAPDIRLLSIAAPIRHALKALGAMALKPEAAAGAVPFAKSLKLPAAALSKSFQTLAKRGILEARRGPGGGYRLAVDPAKISLAEIAAALDVEDVRRGHCVLEEKSCGGEKTCVLHSAAKAADAQLRRELEKTTLADLAGTVKGRKP